MVKELDLFTKKKNLSSDIMGYITGLFYCERV